GGAAAVRAILEPEGLTAARQDADAEAGNLTIPEHDLAAGLWYARALHRGLGQLLSHGGVSSIRQRIDSVLHPNFRLAHYGAIWLRYVGKSSQTGMMSVFYTARSGGARSRSCPHCMNDPRPGGHMASHIARRKFLATLGRSRRARSSLVGFLLAAARSRCDC